ncbi:MAG: class I SAM-dependent methyltransferase [Omnitrophica WOR_2 bacterium]
MPARDASRWNLRYQQERHRTFEDPRPFLVEHASLLPREGLALDVAMGLGGNSGFLLQKGLRVVGIDISETAIRIAKAHLPGLMAFVADLTEYSLPRLNFDVILNFFYLQRDSWPVYLRIMKPGGLLIVQTLTEAMLQEQPEINPAYLLEQGELLAGFKDWEILDYREGWEENHPGHRRAVAGLVARKRA